MILITGSSGLIGRYLCSRLSAENIQFREFDIRNSVDQDISNRQSLEAALKDVHGVVHLAAVSRVIWGERDPTLCRAINVEALSSLVELCLSGSRPWLIFGSSREVYGEAHSFPVREIAPLRPLNVYGRSKRDGEMIVQAGRERGLITNVCRFSSVFGCPHDHADRVAMAFAGVAARGGVMSIEGGTNTFDFTAVEDAVDGLFRLIQATSCRETLPPIHFVTGHGTTLRELANIAHACALRKVEKKDMPARTFDVRSFIGDPSRALELLDWRSKAVITERVAKLVADIASESLGNRAG